MPAPEIALQVAHTSALEPALLERSVRLLEEVFPGDFSAHDWEHSLGGMHALAWHGDLLVGHGSVVQRRMLHRGKAWRTGYVEGFGVAPEWQRRGIGGRMMSALERVIAGAYELGALASSEVAMRFYEARGWLKWRGPTSVLSPSGIRRTPDGDDCVYVWVTSSQPELDRELTCDWRDGDVW